MTTDFRFEDGKLIATRVYDAPIALVFEAWIETSKLKQWWGCAQCTSVRSEIEPKVGGKYSHHMTLEGVENEIPGDAKLIQFDPPNKLAYESTLPTDADVKMQVHVDFSTIDGGTKVVLTHSGIPDIRVEGDVELREIVREGWTAALEKLGKLFEPVS